MLASSCPMNAPRHTAPTAAHGARGCSRTHRGRRDSRVNDPRSKLLMNTFRFCHRQKPNCDTARGLPCASTPTSVTIDPRHPDVPWFAASFSPFTVPAMTIDLRHRCPLRAARESAMTESHLNQAGDRPGHGAPGRSCEWGSDRCGAGVTQVGFDHVKVWEELFGRVGRDVEVDDCAVAGAPVDWRGEWAGLVELQCVQDTQDLVEVPAA